MNDNTIDRGAISQTASSEQQHFDNLVEGIGETWWGNRTAAGLERLRRRAGLVAEKCSGIDNPRVLELGCGTGIFTKFLLEEKEGIQVRGCDISSKAIALAFRRCREYKNIQFEVADVTRLPDAKESYDAVIGNSILHHLPLKKVLEECLRVLKKGGLVMFFEPNMMNPLIAAEKNIPFIGELLQNTKGENAFFRWGLAAVFKEMGWQDIRVSPFDFLHPSVPSSLIGCVKGVGRVCERVPLLKEISGSLSIYARKASD
ncbi:MAG: class I SAM-dependent methyltransferase [Candidatus Omnitrophota bacterium]